MKKLMRNLAMAVVMAAAILAAGCGTTTEVVEVPVEITTSPTETTEVVEIPNRELDLSVTVDQAVTITAATAVGLQHHQAPEIGKIDSRTKRPVKLTVIGSDSLHAKSDSRVIGAPKHGFRIGEDTLVNLGDTDRETDVRVRANFDHQYSGGSKVIGAPKPALKVD